MTAVASLFVDTSPAPDAPSGLHAKPVARPSNLAALLAAPTAPVAKVLAIVARRFSYSYEEITGKDRHKRISSARHVALWLLYKNGLSLTEAGAAIGGRNHRTVMGSLRRVEDAMKSNEASRIAMLGLLAESRGEDAPQ